ncbi:hypothetical protein FRC01_000630 [Tulasnella sp. 417]|nr:hypothetical protein FRC01_000630 [Tulasnella sp. 417]
MDPNAIASMRPHARRALLVYLTALEDDEADSPVQPDTQPTVDPALTQVSASATQSRPTAEPAPPASSVAGPPNGPELVNAAPLSDSEIFNFLNLPSPQAPSAHATVPTLQPPPPPTIVSSPAIASPLTGNPALGYSPSAAQVLAASTGSVGPGIPLSNGSALLPTGAITLPASSGPVPYGIPPVHRNTWGPPRSSAPGPLSDINALTAGSPDISMADGDGEPPSPVLTLPVATDAPPHGSRLALPTLCNFCDEPWPQHASALLLRLVEDLSEFAKPDPTDTNPNHLDAPISKSIDVCMRHRLEKDFEDNLSDPLWPTTIDFDRLPERIVLHAAAALEVVRSPRGNPLFDALEAKVNGGLDLKSLNASEDPLLGTNCGYYGEQGFNAIADTLRFIRKPLKPADTSPLAPGDFYFYVIIPYVAFLLIRDDRPELDEDAAWKELARSNKFGRVRFPDIEYE